MAQDDGRDRYGASSSGASPPRHTRVGGTVDPRAAAPEGLASVLEGLAQRYGVPALDIGQVSFPVENLALIPVEIARRQNVMPVLIREDAIFLAMGDPGERRVIEELEFVSGKRVFPYVAEAGELAVAIEAAYAARDRRETVFRGPRHAAAERESTPGATARPIGAQTDAPAELAGATRARSAPSHGRDFVLDDDDVALVDEPDGSPGAGPTLDSVFAPLRVTRGAKILVVDDEEDIRRLLRRVLEDKGYAVLEAERGSVALELVRQHMPDLIVLDAMLPELHGFDICRRIKASARYGHIPILMVSAVYRGWRFAEDVKSAYGVNGYIEKPFRIAEILSTIESLLAGAPKADERDPESLTAEADAALTAGMAAYRQGDLDRAIGEIERGIGLDPLAYRLHYHLALLVARRGDAFRAIQELETAINLNPRSFPALKNLAVLYQKAGFKNKAIETWERAIGQSPDDDTRGQIKEHLMSLL